MTNSITKTYMEKFSAQTGASRSESTHKTGSDSFESALNKASEKNENYEQDTSKTAVNKPKENDTNKLKEKPVNRDEEVRKPEDSNDISKTEDKNVDKTEKPEETEDVKTLDEAEKLTGAKKGEEIDEKVLAQAAAVLNISVEKLKEILAAIDIKPQEMADMSKLTQVVSKALGAENPVQLLNVYNIKEILKDVEAAVERAISESEVKVDAQVKATVVTVTKPGEANQAFTSLTGNNNPQMGQENVTDQTNQEGETTKTETKADSSTEETLTVQKGVSVSADNTNAELNEMDMDAMLPVNDSSRVRVTNVNTLRVEALRSASPREVMNQIIDRVKVEIKPGMTEIKLTLRPENLGDVTMKIATENGIVTAHFIAENQRVKEIIESNFNQLKNVLSEQGINISQLSVSVNQGDTERQMQEFIQGRAKSQGRISNIINAIDGTEDEIGFNEVDDAEIYENNVNYVV
jgi:flagellar hook-length control protein FliK